MKQKFHVSSDSAWDPSFVPFHAYNEIPDFSVTHRIYHFLSSLSASEFLFRLCGVLEFGAIGAPIVLSLASQALLFFRST